MLSAKRLGLFCSEVVVSRQRLYNVSSRILREFSSKKLNIHNKNNPKIEVTAKNDFVTHQLNTSIAAHLKRQQKLLNNAIEEEKKFSENRRTDYYFDKNTGKIEQTQFHGKSKTGKNQLHDDNKTTKSSQKVTLYNTQKFDAVEDDLHSENDSDDFSLEQLEPPNWEDMNLIAIKKDFYNPSTVTENRSSDEIQEFRSKTHVTTSSGTPKPIFKFNELNDLSQSMLTEIERMGFLDCTTVQSQGIPLALSGVNMIAVSQLR